MLAQESHRERPESQRANFVAASLLAVIAAIAPGCHRHRHHSTPGQVDPTRIAVNPVQAWLTLEGPEGLTANSVIHDTEVTFFGRAQLAGGRLYFAQTVGNQNPHYQEVSVPFGRFSLPVTLQAGVMNTVHFQIRDLNGNEMARRELSLVPTPHLERVGNIEVYPDVVRPGVTGQQGTVRARIGAAQQLTGDPWVEPGGQFLNDRGEAPDTVAGDGVFHGAMPLLPGTVGSASQYRVMVPTQSGPISSRDFSVWTLAGANPTVYQRSLDLVAELVQEYRIGGSGEQGIQRMFDFVDRHSEFVFRGRGPVGGGFVVADRNGFLFHILDIGDGFEKNGAWYPQVNPRGRDHIGSGDLPGQFPNALLLSTIGAADGLENLRSALTSIPCTNWNGSAVFQLNGTMANNLAFGVGARGVLVLSTDGDLVRLPENIRGIEPGIRGAGYQAYPILSTGEELPGSAALTDAVAKELQRGRMLVQVAIGNPDYSWAGFAVAPSYIARYSEVEGASVIGSAGYTASNTALSDAVLSRGGAFAGYPSNVQVGFAADKDLRVVRDLARGFALENAVIRNTSSYGPITFGEANTALLLGIQDGGFETGFGWSYSSINQSERLQHIQGEPPFQGQWMLALSSGVGAETWARGAACITERDAHIRLSGRVFLSSGRGNAWQQERMQIRLRPEGNGAPVLLADRPLGDFIQGPFFPVNSGWWAAAWKEVEIDIPANNRPLRGEVEVRFLPVNAPGATIVGIDGLYTLPE